MLFLYYRLNLSSTASKTPTAKIQLLKGLKVLQSILIVKGKKQDWVLKEMHGD